MSTRLSFAARRKTFGGWGKARRAIARHHASHSSLLVGQVELLVDRMVAHGMAPRPLLRQEVPQTAPALTTGQFIAALEWCLRLLEEGITPEYALPFTVIAAADKMTMQEY